MALRQVQTGPCPDGAERIIVGERSFCLQPCLPGWQRRISAQGVPACVKPAVSLGWVAAVVLGSALVWVKLQ
jgi:hypothetical protein